MSYMYQRLHVRIYMDDASLLALSLFQVFLTLHTPPLPVQGGLVDHSVHLLPAGLAAASGEVVPWQSRPQGSIMVGVTLALEGSRGFKV